MSKARVESSVGSVRVAILGAGPIGIEAALYAHAAGLSPTVYEAGQPGEHVARWSHIKLFTPFGWNSSTLGREVLLRARPDRELPDETDLLTARDWLDSYLLPLTQCEPLKSRLQSQTTVLTMGRVGWRKTDAVDSRKPLPAFRLLVRTPDGKERFDLADVILDCTGTYSRPNCVGDGGIPAAGEQAARAQITYGLEPILGARQAYYAGKTIALIGGGYSAATTLCDLMTLSETHQSTWVVWLTRSPKPPPLTRISNDPLKERDRLALRANAFACRCDGNLEYHSGVRIEELITHGPDQGFRVAGYIGNKPVSWEVDRVIANVGYRPSLGLCEELRVAEPIDSFETAEPGYFILGSKSVGRSSNFLLRDGREQIRQAFAKILEQPRLDLYSRRSAA